MSIERRCDRKRGLCYAQLLTIGGDTGTDGEVERDERANAKCGRKTKNRGRHESKQHNVESRGDTERTGDERDERMEWA